MSQHQPTPDWTPKTDAEYEQMIRAHVATILHWMSLPEAIEYVKGMEKDIYETVAQRTREVYGSKTVTNQSHA